MNKTFRSVWNACKQAYVAAAETVSARGKPCSGAKSTTVAAALLGGLLIGGGSSQAAGPSPGQLPMGGQVSAGQATIAQSGSTLVVQQGTDRAAIDWQSFSVGGTAKVQFIQPTANSAMLNRVLGSDVSTIQGQLSANGRVYLLNPNGILFTPTAQVNVGGLVATTLNLSNTDFMAGHDRLTGDSIKDVVNQGTIRVATGGAVALIAAKVVNAGEITAPSGSVLLAAGRKVRLDLGGPAQIEIEEGALNALIEQSGSIRAADGVVYLTAKAASQLSSSVINHSGLIEASSLSGTGGLVMLEADNIRLSAGSRIDATGAVGGGSVLVGGDWQGSGVLRQATRVTADSGSVIDASATVKGDGGKVVLWSDVHNNQSVTTVDGALYARGGAQGGNGGRIETSGAQLNTGSLKVDASATQGQAGLWLIDPYDYTIGSTEATNIVNALNTGASGTSVEVNTGSSVVNYGGSATSGSGNITVSSAISANTTNTSADLSLVADGKIDVNAAITVGGKLLLKAAGNVTVAANLTTNGNDITLWSDSDASGRGGINVKDNVKLDSRTEADRLTSTNTTGGGRITLAGGLDDGGVASGTNTLRATGLVAGDGIPDGYAANFWPSAYGAGVNINYGIGLGTITPSAGHNSNLKMYSGGGEIRLQGRISEASYSSGNWPTAVLAHAGYDINAGSNGGITLLGVTSLASGTIGFDMQAWRENNSGTLTSNILTHNGDINIISRVSSPFSGSLGIAFDGNAQNGNAVRALIASTGTGNITLNGAMTGTNGTADMRLTSVDLLAAHGNINLAGSGSGFQVSSYMGDGLVIGSKSGSLVPASDSNVVITADQIAINKPFVINTTGTLTVQPNSSSFTNALNWGTNITLGNTVSGLTLGKASNTANVTLTAAQTVNGPVAIYGGDVTVNADLTSSQSNANVLIKGSGNILLSGEKAITTQGGSAILWANSDGQNTAGYVALRSDFATSAGAKIQTNGGHIWIGGGSGSSVWNGLAVGDGYAVSGSSISFLNDANNGSLPAGVFMQGAKLLSGGGNIKIAGYSQQSNSRAIVTVGNVEINSGAGEIEAQAIATGTAGALGTGWNHDASRASMNGVLSVTSNKNSASAVLINADATASNVLNGDFQDEGSGLAGRVSLITTNGGGITYNSLGSSTRSSAYGLRLGYSTAQGGELNLLADSGAVLLNTGTRKIQLANNLTSATLGFKTGTAVTTSSSHLRLVTNDLSAAGALNFNTFGQVVVEPTSGSAFTSTVNTQSLNYSAGVSGLTIGHASNTSNVTIGGATAIAGPVTLYGGNLAVNGSLTATNSTVSLNRTGVGSGTVTQTSPIVADNLLLSGGDVTLNHASNSVVTLAATGVGNLSYRNSSALSIGSVSTINGISATGTVDVQTLTGDLTVAHNISTTNTGSAAVVLNAGRNAAAGVAPGGNLLLSGSPSISGGANSTIRLYTGEIGVTGDPSSLVTQGQNRFRYNADESTNFAAGSWTNLSSGSYVIYRERPLLVVNGGGPLTMTYGDTPPSLSVTGMILGDTGSSISIANRIDSSSGHIKAGTYSFTSDLQGLGYGISNSLTVDPKTINAITGITAANKTYDGSTSATLNSSSAGFTGMISGDTLTVASGATGAFADKNAGTGKTVTISGLVLGGADAGNYNLSTTTATTTADIAKASISAITGITAANKTYDGSTSATLNSSSAGFTGMIIGDTLVVASGATGAFADKNAGTGKTVTISGLVLGGTDAGNYNLSTTTASTTADIAKASISAITGITAANKTYDGSTSATLDSSNAGFTGMISGDTLVVASGATGAFANKNAGTGKTVTISGLVLGGTDAGNYNLSTTTATTTADIAKASISAITGITAANKTYDGSTSATLNSSSAGFTGMISGDTLTVASGATGAFSDKNAGTGKTVTISGLVLGGTDAGNYNLSTTTASTTADIAKASISAITGITAANKTYDGSTSATLNSSSAGFTGMISGDTLTVASGATGAFSDKNAGTGKTVTISGLVLGGTDAGNYNLSTTTASTTADIAKASISAITGITAANKTYDGSTSATLDSSNAGFTGMISGDTLVVASGATGAFANKNAGTGKTVTISGLVLGGTDAGNYNLSTTTATTTADIAKASISAITGITAANKTYDGSTSATLDSSNAGFTGMISGDTLVVASGATGAFANKNAGTGKTVTISGLVLGGTDAGNYTLASDTASSSGTINPLPISLAIQAQSKRSGDPDPTWSYQVLSGQLLSGDELVLSRPTGEATGRYLISATHPNYAIAAADAYLTVSPKVEPAAIVNGLLTVAPVQSAAQPSGRTSSVAPASSAAVPVTQGGSLPVVQSSSGLMLIPVAPEQVRAIEVTTFKAPDTEGASGSAVGAGSSGTSRPAAAMLQTAQSLGYTGVLVVEGGVRLPTDGR